MNLFPPHHHHVQYKTNKSNEDEGLPEKYKLIGLVASDDDTRNQST